MSYNQLLPLSPTLFEHFVDPGSGLPALPVTGAPLVIEALPADAAEQVLAAVEPTLEDAATPRELQTALKHLRGLAKAKVLVDFSG